VGGLPSTEDLPLFVSPPQTSRTTDFGRLGTDDFINGSDEFDSSDIVLGPGDSHYELSAIVDGAANDDSQVDLPAIATDRPPGKPNQAGRTGSPTRLSTSAPATHSQRARNRHGLAVDVMPVLVRKGGFVHLWSRCQLVATLAFGALAMSILGFFLVRASIAGQSLTAATSALVVGLLGTLAFVLLSFTAIVLSAVLIELADSLRQLHQDVE
jgi:hypothetical protein